MSETMVRTEPTAVQIQERVDDQSRGFRSTGKKLERQRSRVESNAEKIGKLVAKRREAERPFYAERRNLRTDPRSEHYRADMYALADPEHPKFEALKEEEDKVIEKMRQKQAPIADKMRSASKRNNTITAEHKERALNLAADVNESFASTTQPDQPEQTPRQVPAASVEEKQ